MVSCEVVMSLTHMSEVIFKKIHIDSVFLVMQCDEGFAKPLTHISHVQIYGAPITKGKYKGQVVLPLVDMTVEDIEDSAEGANGIQINDKRKSFIVYLISPSEKSKWIAAINRFIGLSRDAAGLDPVLVGSIGAYMGNN